MIVNLKRTDLIEALEYTGRAVSKKPQIDIIGYTHIECADRVKLTGYDFELGIVSQIDGNILNTGSCCFEGNTLLNFIKKCSDEEVKLSVEKGQMTVVCGKPKLKLTVTDDKDFPILPELKEAEQIELSNLSDKIKRVAFCASENKQRPILGGVNLKITKDELSMTGCDGFRFSMISEPMKAKALNITFPKSALENLRSIVGNEKVDIKFDKKSAEIQMNDITIYIRLLSGEYVDLSKILSRDNGAIFKADGQKIAETIERLSVVANNDTPVIVEISNNLMSLSCKTSKADFEEYITTDYQGEDLKIAFNFRYFSEAFKGTEEVNFDIQSKQTGVIIRESDRVQMIMPMMVNI